MAANEVEKNTEKIIEEFRAFKPKNSLEDVCIDYSPKKDDFLKYVIEEYRKF